MENIIPISRSNGFEYSVVLLPKEAEKIEKDKHDDQEVIQYEIPEEVSGFNCRWVRVESINIPASSELIGSLEDLTEEQAREIVEERYGRPGQWRDYMFGRKGEMVIAQCGAEYRLKTALESLKSLIESKGIQTENHLKKPEFNYDFPPDGPNDSMWHSANEDFDQRLLEYNQASKELKKILILKTKICT